MNGYFSYAIAFLFRNHQSLANPKRMCRIFLYIRVYDEKWSNFIAVLIAHSVFSSLAVILSLPFVVAIASSTSILLTGSSVGALLRYYSIGCSRFQWKASLLDFQVLSRRSYSSPIFSHEFNLESSDFNLLVTSSFPRGQIVFVKGVLKTRSGFAKNDCIQFSLNW